MNALADSNIGHYLTFKLGNEFYGIDILRVQEIKTYEALTPIPNAPKYTSGLVNLRGAVVPIYDLRVRFGFTDNHDESTVFIVVKVSVNGVDKVVGLVVDSVSDTYEIDLTQRQPAPQNEISQDYMYGLVNMNGHMIILLDVNNLCEKGL